MKNIILLILLMSCLMLPACTPEIVTQTVISTTTTTKTITVTTTPLPPSSTYLITKNISYKIIQKTDNYWYFSWQVTIKNLSYNEITLYVKVNFLDRDGFSLEMGNDIVSISPSEEKTILGEEMIEVDKANDVVRAVVDIDVM